MSATTPSGSPPSPHVTPADPGDGTVGRSLAALDALDAALLDVRRLGRRPGYRARLLGAVGDRVDTGTVRVLRAVEQAAEASPEVCVGDVAERLEIDPSTASRLVEQQVSSGTLRRGRSTNDRRRTTLALTTQGRALLAEVTSARLDLLAEVTRDWSVDDVVSLTHSLDRLRTGFARFEQPDGDTRGHE